MKFLRKAFAAIAVVALGGGFAPAAAAADYAAATADSPVRYAPPAQPSMYSFADVFRLTVAGAAMTDNPLVRLPASAELVDYQLRVASSVTPGEPQQGRDPQQQGRDPQQQGRDPQQQPAPHLFSIASPSPLPASYVFSIGAMPQPERWLLILSGLAAAGWVARRRLGS
jgi:hypothetical protein